MDIHSQACCTLHGKAEGPTLAENNKESGDFAVVVTGAWQGLGYHTALAYPRAGATGIAICCRTVSDLGALEKDLLKINPDLKVLTQVVDVSKPGDVGELAEQVKRAFRGRLDVVVSNAGIYRVSSHMMSMRRPGSMSTTVIPRASKNGGRGSG